MAKKENKYKDYNRHKETYHATGIGEYLGLGRAINFDNYPTRLAFLFTIVSCVAETFYQGAVNGLSSSASMMFGANVGLSLLFSFFIANELDPDRKVGGLIGGILSAVGVHFLGEGNIIVLLWLLWMLRMFNRTAGDRHRMADDILIIGCAAWLGANEFWVYPVITGAAFVVEALITAGYFGSYFLAAIAFASTFFANVTREPANLSLLYVYMCGIAFMLFLPELRVASLCQAVGDKDGNPLYKTRLIYCQAIFIMIIFALVVLHGDKQAIVVLPAIMSAVGCGAYLLYDLVVNKPYHNLKRR